MLNTFFQHMIIILQSHVYGTVPLKGNVALARELRVRVESTYLSAIEIRNRY